MDSYAGVSTSIDTDLARVLSTIPVVVILVNEEQRVVWGHEQLLELVGADRPEQCRLPGPGDLLRCENALAGREGCGSAPGCDLCGALRAMRESQRSGKVIARECRITVRDENGGQSSLDLVATASPYRGNGETLTMLTLQDASAEKRRRALERIFFHDILNTAGGLTGLVSEIKRTDDPSERDMMLGLLESSTRSLLEEISAQRQLSAAEQGELALNLQVCAIADIFVDVRAILRHHPAGTGRLIALSGNYQGEQITTDASLLKRVLLNLAKNALEASDAGELIELSYQTDGERALFTVHNEGYIPREIQLQLFYRSFSTKGPGRGLGTYSARLLAEQYLNGTVSFSTSPDEGTRFTVALPR
jgi:signal transduction histidine kinase